MVLPMQLVNICNLVSTLYNQHFFMFRYKHEILVDGDPVIFEICDTCPKVNFETWSVFTLYYFILFQSLDDLPPSETMTWADGFVLVYSITDRASFNYIKQVFQHIQVTMGKPCNWDLHQHEYNFSFGFEK